MRSFLVFIVCILATHAEARFYFLDADEVDREERVSGVYYLDILSYQYPESWFQKFDNAQAAYRSQAGSLNIRNFYLLEEIKFNSSKTTQTVDLHIYQRREEEVLERHFLQDIRVQFNGLRRGYIAILADGTGGTLKKWNSLGLATGYKEESKQLEFYYWAVHYYYNDKETENDSYRKALNTVGGKFNWLFAKQSQIKVGIEADSPLTWERRSENYEYKYLRQIQTVQLRSPKKENIYLLLDFKNEMKRESKSFYSDAYGKFLRRTAQNYDLSLVFDKETVVHKVSLGYAQRQAHYDYTNPTLVNVHANETLTSTNDRREILLGYTQNRSLRDTWNVQWGVFANHVTFEFEDRHRTEMHSKFQLALEYSFSTYASIFMNSTWIPERLVRSFPIRPFGGGEVALMVTL